MNFLLLLLVLTLVVLLYLRKSLQKPTVIAHSNSAMSGSKLYYGFKSPDWVKNASVYQMNIRQMTKEGTIAAAATHLPRIKELGAEILWIMPFFPICEREKKQEEGSSPENSWGSPYAPYDFESIHERLGTFDDFRAFITQAHELGFKVILDFVPNHTGWDSKWMIEHPEWFVHKKDGTIMPVTSDQGEEWADIAQLDFTDPALREAWMQAHEFWVKNFDLDGYREDCAWAISVEWWLELRQRLDAIKPVYMLAEDEVHGREQFDVCFETNYGWGTHHFMKQIAQKGAPASTLHKHTEGIKERHGTRGWQMNFTQNHDENTWHGSEYELFGGGADCYMALCFTMEGVGLIYNGQEVSMGKRLSFFGKDEIDWTGASRATFFRTLTDLKKQNKALWSGRNGGFIEKIPTNHDDKVYAFTREKEGDKVVCIFNMKNEAVDVTLGIADYKGDYHDVFNKTKYPPNPEYSGGQALSIGATFSLKPYQFYILTNK